jgi:beta-lactam-binding protein with PASTA domain
MKLEISDTQKHSQEIDAGLVLESNPPSGAKIKRGRTVRVILSSGFPKALVPDLIAKSVREAQLLGDQENFTVRMQDLVFSESVPVGHIVAQVPEPNSHFINKVVHVLISRGPNRKLGKVPDFIDRPLLPVLRELRAQGMPFKVWRRGEGTRDISNNDPFELRRMRVYRQSPEPGTLVDMASPETIILRVDWIGR